MANEVTILVREQGTAQTGRALQGLQGIVVGLGAAVGLMAAQVARDIAGMAGTAIQTGIAFNGMKEQAQIAFTSMLGSGEKAASFLAELQSFAAKTPFEFPDLLEGSQRLLAMGFAAKDLIPTMTALGDATAAMGGNSVMIDRLTLAMGQMLAKGKVSGEEMRQFAEAGIPAWDMLAKKIGVSIPEAMALSEKGAISAATGIAALTEGMNARFGGMMEQQSQTFNGLISTLKDNARIFAGEVTKPLFEDMKAALQDFSAWYAEHGDEVIAVSKQIIDVIGFMAQMFGKWAKWIYDVFIGPMVGWVSTLVDAWRRFGNDTINIVETWANGIISAVNKVLETLGKFTDKLRGIPGIGDKLPQFGAETIAPLDLSRFRPGLGGGAPFEESVPNVLTETGQQMLEAVGETQQQQYDMTVSSARRMREAAGVGMQETEGAVVGGLAHIAGAAQAAADVMQKAAERTLSAIQQLWASAGGPGTSTQGFQNLALLAMAAEAAQNAGNGAAGQAAANAILNSGGNITVNVSGIVGDPVATGQAIAATLNAAAQGGPVINSGAVGE